MSGKEVTLEFSISPDEVRQIAKDLDTAVALRVTSSSSVQYAKDVLNEIADKLEG